jgi:hypothetical protein
VATAQGSLVFEDPVLDQNASLAIEWVRRQSRGNAQAGIPAIGVVTCVSVNPSLDQFWLMDDRLDDPTGDGHSQLDQGRERLHHVVYHKGLPF